MKFLRSFGFKLIQILKVYQSEGKITIRLETKSSQINLYTSSAKALNLSKVEMEVAWNNIQNGLKEAIKAFQ
jgi:hypothetical protein